MLSLYLRPKITGFTTISYWNSIPISAICIYSYILPNLASKLFIYRNEVYRLELRYGYVVESSIVLVHVNAH